MGTRLLEIGAIRLVINQLSLSFSLSASGDFSDVAVLPAGLAGSIILALTSFGGWGSRLQLKPVPVGPMHE
jgi:uncharacterized membrane protein YvlD (DUF360 family)